jgi:hypothetical protein
VPLMTEWIPVTVRTLRSIYATDGIVSNGTDVRASTPFGARTGTSNINVAKFTCAQIISGGSPPPSSTSDSGHTREAGAGLR